MFLLTRNLVEVTESGTAAALRQLLPQGCRLPAKPVPPTICATAGLPGFRQITSRLPGLVATTTRHRPDSPAPAVLSRYGADLMRGIENQTLQLAAPPASNITGWMRRGDSRPMVVQARSRFPISPARNRRRVPTAAKRTTGFWGFIA